MVGYAFRQKILGHRFWTRSVWEDERAFMAFVRKGVYRDAMGALRPHMAETTFLRWRVRGDEIPLTRQDALRRAEAPHS